jgi:hypothetical protein
MKGGFEGVAFLGQGDGEGVRRFWRAPDGPRVFQNHGFRIRAGCCRCHGLQYDFLGKGMEKGLEGSGEDWRSLESSGRSTAIICVGYHHRSQITRSVSLMVTAILVFFHMLGRAMGQWPNCLISV